MRISARNQLKGRVKEIVLGPVTTHVAVKVGGNIIESVITRRSAEDLQLKKGDEVTVLIKATEVLIAKDN